MYVATTLRVLWLCACVTLRPNRGDRIFVTFAVYCFYFLQGSRLTFQLSSQVASERFDFASQNKFSPVRLFCVMSECVQYVKFLAELSTVNMPLCNLKSEELEC